MQNNERRFVPSSPPRTLAVQQKIIPSTSKDQDAENERKVYQPLYPQLPNHIWKEIQDEYVGWPNVFYK